MDNSFLSERLKERELEGNLRSLTAYPDLVDFVSNDYLGLGRNQELAQRIQDRASHDFQMNGATGSRLLSGNHAAFQSLEQQLSEIFGSEAALVFNSGYHANQAVVSAVAGKGDTVLYDQLAHVCLKEGAWLSKAETNAFRHNDPDDLEMKLQKASGRKFVVTESIFSMDGDLAPLEEIITICQENEAHLIIDEAHSTGAYGPEGSGLSARYLDSGVVLARIFTFGKAMGVHGACVTGDQVLIDYLVNFGRPFIYTTALPPHSVLAIRESFNYLKVHQELQGLLQNKISLFSDQFGRSVSTTAIQPVIVGSNVKAKEISARLREAGFDVRPILSPTVQKGKERLRISLHVHNSDEETIELARQLKSLL